MAEKKTPVENKKLLLVALALGLLVVLIYNVHIDRVRKAGEGKQVYLLKARYDLKKGSKITAKNVERYAVSEKLVEGLTGLIVLDSEKALDQYANDRLNQDVQINSYLTHQSIQKGEEKSPSGRIKAGMVGCPLAIDPNLSPGEILRPGDYVNISGEFQFSGERRRYYGIIEGVRVLAVGGQSVEAEGPTVANPGVTKGVRSYRTILVEVSPEVALKLADLTRGMTVIVHVLSSDPSAGLPPNAGKIDSELEKLARTAKLID